MQITNNSLLITGLKAPAFGKTLVGSEEFVVNERKGLKMQADVYELSLKDDKDWIKEQSPILKKSGKNVFAAMLEFFSSQAVVNQPFKCLVAMNPLRADEIIKVSLESTEIKGSKALRKSHLKGKTDAGK